MNNCDQMNLFVFVVLVVCFTITRQKYSNDEEQNVKMMCTCVLLLLVGIILWNIFYSEDPPQQEYPPIEEFRFEVSPWKLTCGTDHPDSRCCGRGYVGGKKPYFEYSSDEQRGQCGNGVCSPQEPTERVENEDTLKETYLSKQRIIEGFEGTEGCGCT